MPRACPQFTCLQQGRQGANVGLPTHCHHHRQVPNCNASGHEAPNRGVVPVPLLALGAVTEHKDTVVGGAPKVVTCTCAHGGHSKRTH
jgi:hypothetical protein